MLRVIFFIMFFMSSVAYAEPKNCPEDSFKVDDKNLTLTGISQGVPTQIYFFKNTSKESLWLDHPVNKPSMSAGWSSYLRPGNWSALLLNRKNFAITCAVIQPGKVDYQNCSKMIKTCVATPSAAFVSKRKGTYWLAEDLPWPKLMAKLEKRGVTFMSKT